MYTLSFLFFRTHSYCMQCTENNVDYKLSGELKLPFLGKYDCLVFKKWCRTYSTQQVCCLPTLYGSGCYIKHLPDCPGQVKVRFGQAFCKTKKKQLLELGKLKLYCGHTTFSTNFFFFFVGASKYVIRASVFY